MFLFDPLYFLMIAPALLLAFIAQMWVKSSYQRAMREPAPLIMSTLLCGATSGTAPACAG